MFRRRRERSKETRRKIEGLALECSEESWIADGKKMHSDATKTILIQHEGSTSRAPDGAQRRKQASRRVVQSKAARMPSAASGATAGRCPRHRRAGRAGFPTPVAARLRHRAEGTELVDERQDAWNRSAKVRQEANARCPRCPNGKTNSAGGPARARDDGHADRGIGCAGSGACVSKRQSAQQRAVGRAVRESGRS